MKNKLIIFDCFGVIFDDVAPAFLEKYLPKEKALILKDKLFTPADLGKITYDYLLSNLARELGLTKEQTVNEWNNMLVLNSDIIPYFEKFQKDYDIALLSNAPSSLVESLFEKHNLNQYFDKVFISYKYRIIKPQKEFYLLCVNSFNKKYNKIYMTDDNVKNLENLESIGITPILFENVKSLDIIK